MTQQNAIVDQYELTCGQVRGETEDGEGKDRIDELHRRYRQIDCELLDRDVEIAEIDFEYNQEILRSTRMLVENNIKTKFELVIEEYDLSQSKARLEGFRRRASIYKNKLAGQANSAVGR